MRHSITYKMFLLAMTSLSLGLALSPTTFAYQKQEKANVEVVKDAKFSHTAFTYQGQLKDANGPVNGSFDFQFILYSAQTGGARLGVSENNDVVLTNGLFSFKLDFGRAAFETKESWLEIGVRPGSSMEPYTVLFPRQKLTPTPYAIFAQHEQWSLIGVPVGFAGRVEKATVITDEVADQGVTDAKKVSEETAKSSESLNAKATDAEGKAAAGPQGTAGTIAKFVDATNLGDSIMVESNGSVGIGTKAPEAGLHLLLDNTASNGLSIDRLVQRPELGDQGYGFRIRSGIQRLDGTGFINTHFLVDAGGRVGIGTAAPADQLTVQTETSNYGLTHTDGSVVVGSWIGAGATGTNGGWFGTKSNHPLRFFTADSTARMTIDTSGNVGIGTTIPLVKLDVFGSGLTEASVHSRGGQAVLSLNSEIGGTGQVWTLESGLFAQQGLFGIYDRTAAKARLTIDKNGVTGVDVLQIKGGADFSENFDVSSAPTTGSEAVTTRVEAGMVVSIDPTNPGKLALSTQAYDRRVAGIISGAGGVKPGMVMGQEGSLADGKYPVALSGRVYCRADASNGPIEPGDLLTTSDIPGHAMKVTDHGMAQGAIIGKAMTSLKQGKGLVLILVTLQ